MSTQSLRYYTCDACGAKRHQEISPLLGKHMCWDCRDILFAVVVERTQTMGRAHSVMVHDISKATGLAQNPMPQNTDVP